jgi:hypothetical protein
MIAGRIARSGKSPIVRNMQTVEWLPSGLEYYYFFNCVERFGMAKASAEYRQAISHARVEFLVQRVVLNFSCFSRARVEFLVQREEERGAQSS